jgi:hypothetical protein
MTLAGDAGDLLRLVAWFRPEVDLGYLDFHHHLE